MWGVFRIPHLSLTYPSINPHMVLFPLWICMQKRLCGADMSDMGVWCEGWCERNVRDDVRDEIIGSPLFKGVLIEKCEGCWLTTGLVQWWGRAGFFLPLLGLRPGLFRCHTDSTDGTDFSGKQIYICHTGIYMSHRNSQKSQKVPSARAALRKRSENFCDFGDFRVTINILTIGLQCSYLISREARVQGYHPLIDTRRLSASLYFESLSLMSLVKKPNSSL